MDAVPAKLERDAMTVLEDYQHRFWLLQRVPGISIFGAGIAGDLFEAWRARRLGRLTTERDAVRLRIAELRREMLKLMPPGEPFVCVCGQEGDPGDSAFAAVHQEHFVVAGLAKIDPASLWRAQR